MNSEKQADIPEKNDSTDTKDTSDSVNEVDDTMQNLGEALASYWSNFFNGKIGKLKEENQKFLLNLSIERDKTKRLENKISSERKYDGVKLAREILGSYDNLLRAIEAGKQNSSTDNIAAWVEGIEAVYREFQETLKRNHIQEINPKTGDLFDHNLHEALYYAPVPGFSDGQITEVRQTGFIFHTRLLRPAKVGVAECIPSEEPEPSPDAEPEQDSPGVGESDTPQSD